MLVNHRPKTEFHHVVTHSCTSFPSQYTMDTSKTVALVAASLALGFVCGKVVSDKSGE